MHWSAKNMKPKDMKLLFKKKCRTWSCKYSLDAVCLRCALRTWQSLAQPFGCNLQLCSGLSWNTFVSVPICLGHLSCDQRSYRQTLCTPSPRLRLLLREASMHCCRHVMPHTAQAVVSHMPMHAAAAQAGVMTTATAHTAWVT